MDSNDSWQWLSDMSLARVLSIFRSHGVVETLFKVLPRNANSKNQIYLGSDLAQLGKIPSGSVEPYESKSRKAGTKGPIFRAPISLNWVAYSGAIVPAPNAKLIAYPQFPEVRFSGFLDRCNAAPSFLFAIDKRGLEPGRVLFLGIREDEEVIALAVPPEAPAAKELSSSGPHDGYGALSILSMDRTHGADSFHMLLAELCRIHQLGWTDSIRLNRSGQIVGCASSNCGGNTLEANLGIRSNGLAEPDFHGWEVKARTVANIQRPGKSTVTLFTPEPSGGVYCDQGPEAFVRRFGYPDTKGRDDRLNFGGVYRCDATAHARTRLRLVLDGYHTENRTFEPNGAVRLLDANDMDALSWSFAKLMDHWKKKHAHAAYVPCEQRMQPSRKYRYANEILVGEGAQFRLFLQAVADGRIYYDPGIKLERASTSKPVLKRRSQIRVSSTDLESLYSTARIVSACS